MVSHLHIVLVACALATLVQPVVSTKVWAWFYKTRNNERCTGESIDYSYEARLDDGGQCITGVEGHDGSLWVNVDGKQGGLGCMWLYEATDCRGYTAAWEFTANNWCFEIPRMGKRSWRSFRYNKDACWAERVEKPYSMCQIAHDGQELKKNNTGMMPGNVCSTP